MHSQGEIPGVTEIVYRKKVSEPVWLPGLLKEIGMVPSTSEGKRVIEQGGVYVAEDDQLVKVAANPF